MIIAFLALWFSSDILTLYASCWTAHGNTTKNEMRHANTVALAIQAAELLHQENERQHNDNLSCVSSVAHWIWSFVSSRYTIMSFVWVIHSRFLGRFIGVDTDFKFDACIWRAFNKTPDSGSSWSHVFSSVTPKRAKSRVGVEIRVP